MSSPIGRDNSFTTVTCNSGIKLIPVPDFYFAIDQNAGHVHKDAARHAQSLGSTLITLHRDCRAMRDRCVDWYDVHLRIPDQGEPTREEFGAFRYSGPLCIQFACLQGAKTVYLVGCDGYRMGKDHQYDGCYFDYEWRTKPRARTWPIEVNREVLIPGYSHLAKIWHDVEFVLVGNPVYRIEAPNWRVVDPETL